MKNNENDENEKCSCGSGKYPYPIYDGYGIYLTRVCERCEPKVVSRFRKDIFEAYDCDEQIDEDI
jgi:hypothetical protein